MQSSSRRSTPSDPGALDAKPSCRAVTTRLVLRTIADTLSIFLVLLISVLSGLTRATYRATTASFFDMSLGLTDR
jgi:hypothetical protein